MPPDSPVPSFFPSIYYCSVGISSRLFSLKGSHTTWSLEAFAGSAMRSGGALDGLCRKVWSEWTYVASLVQALTKAYHPESPRWTLWRRSCTSAVKMYRVHSLVPNSLCRSLHWIHTNSKLPSSNRKHHWHWVQNVQDTAEVRELWFSSLAVCVYLARWVRQLISVCSVF